MFATTKLQPTHYLKAWILTTRPKTLILSIVPFLVGTLFAWPKTAELDWFIMFFAMLSAFFIQIGTNFINDVYDAKNNADKPTRLGPKRGIQSGILTISQVFLAGISCFGIALLLGVPLVMKGGFFMGLVLLLSVSAGFLYTGGPKPLAYNGLGELFVMIFFGLIATSTAYFFQTGFVDMDILLVGSQLGALATMTIAINNLRDIEDDALSNKKTLTVRFGRLFARVEITLLAFFPFLLNIYFGNLWMMLIPCLMLPLVYMILRHIWDNEPSASYNAYLGLSILLYVGFSVSLVIGYLL